MNCADLNENEREFLDGIHRVRERARGEYLSILALMLSLQPDDTSALRRELERATNGDLKRAIKCMREVQRRYQWPEEIDRAVSMIRREFLRKGTV